MTVWSPIRRPITGFLDNLSDSISMVEASDPGVLAEVQDSPMWIASDYSGQHKGAAHEAYSFLITTSDSLRQWNRERSVFRARFLPDGRRLSFKNANEPVRANALRPFLRLANVLKGNLVTFMVDTRVQSLFKTEAKADASDLPEVFPAGTSCFVVENTLRVGAFASLLVAGLRAESQHATWISDQDQVLEHHERRERLGEFIRCTIWGMTGWNNPGMLEFGTTALDWPDRRLEDFVAIADLAAGAMCSLAPALAVPEAAGLSKALLPRETVADERTCAILDWAAEPTSALRKLLLRVTLDEHGRLRARAEYIRSLDGLSQP